MSLYRVDPEDLASVAASVAILEAARVVDDPDDPPRTTEVDALRLRFGWDLEPAQRFLYFAEPDPGPGSEPVGVLNAHVPQRDNRHLVEADVAIHPDHRRRGHGAAMLAEIEAWTRELGRNTIWAYPAADDAAGCRFAESHGFVRAGSEARRVQRPAENDWDRIEELEKEALEASSGYRLERLRPPTPDAVLSELVEVTAAINDAPMGDLHFEATVFDRQRLHDFETASAARDERLYRVVARRIVDGVAGGHTVISVQPRLPTHGVQYDTAVARDHRGRRLGLAVKIDMMRWLAEAEPQLEQIETWNNTDNSFMIGVNEALGYRPSRVFADYQRVLS